MAAVALWPYSAEIIFFIRNSGRAAALPELPFHGVGVVADNGIGCCRAAPEAQRVNPLFMESAPHRGAVAQRLRGLPIDGSPFPHIVYTFFRKTSVTGSQKAAFCRCGALFSRKRVCYTGFVSLIFCHGGFL